MPKRALQERGAAAILLASLVLATTPIVAQPSPAPVREGVLSGPASTAPQVSVRAPENAAVGEVIVQLERDAFVADGITRVAVNVELRNRKGELLTEAATVTIESTARVLLPGAQTDETGPAALDRDKITPGVQLRVEGGRATFWLLAPATPQDVKLRVTAGEATAEGLVTFNPELREMLAVGLVEGIISLKRKGPDTIQPVRTNDGFEQELRGWSQRFSDDKGGYGVRAALFLKGKIKGDALLTLAYDSDKYETDARKRLLTDVRPDEYYPVYGDSSIKGYDAVSASKLYVRIDKNKHYLLYGDFQTSANFTPLTGGRLVAPLRLRDLGQYSRTLTGVRGHVENERGFASGFATRDTLKQVVEEYASNGTSGPYAVRNNSAIAGTDKVEIITRDRNNPSIVLAVEPLVRLTDYVFEPFSGRILLNRSVPSRDANGNPLSIRITYEVDQGGEAFWLFGVDGQLKLGPQAELGGALIEDRNTLSPYRLGSVNTGLRFGENTQLVAEFARSEGRYNTGVGVDINLTPGLNSVVGDASGNAARVALEHKGEKTDIRASFGRSDKTFDNPAASFNGGRGDAGVRAAHKLTDTVTLFGEAVRSEDRVADGERTGAQLGAAFKLTEKLTVDVAVKRMEENGKPVSPGATVPPNPSSGTGTAGSPLTPSGGFFGTGADAINPNTGTAILSPTTGAANTGAGTPLDATTLQLGAQYKATERTTLAGEVEHDIEGDNKRRVALGLGYRIAERTRLYGKYETQQGLASIYSLDPADRSTTFVFGADTTYAPGAQFYSEYRLRDALNDSLTARDAQLASGLRNTWSVSPGVTWVTGAEYLKVLDGGGQQAYSLVGGLDYTADPLWKGLARLEWRRLEDDLRTPTFNEAQDSYLSTLSAARKLSRDWTLLARNYLLYTDLAVGNRVQDRVQVGFAWRPTDTNRFNALAKYEYRYERDTSGQPTAAVGTLALPVKRDVHIVSTHADYHPSRPWWMTGRFAAKTVNELIYAGAEDRYTAYLLSGRVVYDITENWDLGVLAAGLFSPQGRSRQTAYGLEVGYLLKTNLWLSVGFNVTGFSDRDLTAAEYTNQGAFIRLRFKFDENLFRGKDREINRALDRQ
jgi:hypothetical protein